MLHTDHARRHGRLRWLLVLSALAFAATSEAAFFERLLMPGPLAEVHAEFEDDCSNCHSDAGKSAQGDRCLACHDHRDIALDIELGVGLHGRLDELQAKGCRLCHGEHRGRDADILGFQPLTFDHDRTDFPLREAHTETRCSSCHEPDRKYSAAAQRCVDCHDRHDAHEGRLGEHCSDCHNESNWSRTEFDHSVASDFKLVGKHEEAPCKLCHLDSDYREIDTECISCHRIDDRHIGRNGKQCARCHTAEKWTDIVFDHDRETKFALRERHAEIACNLCHQATDKKRKRDRECIACHRAADVHKGRNGDDCQRCHNERGWSDSDFDHFKKTRYRLLGAHADLSCLACHKGSPEDEKDRTECNDCHRPGPTHQDRMPSDCADCHTPKQWDETEFDHAKAARFELSGGHADRDCVSCHSLPVAQQKLSSECYDCHRRDDPHAGRQGSDCAGCHAPESWQTTDFDHDLTPFPLLGQHAVVACEQCHESRVFSGTESACAACHGESDEHRSTLGERCQRCHNPNAWSAWLFDHEAATGYAPSGPHEGLRCADCHTAAMGREVIQSGVCSACHRADDIHDGGFGAQCGRCHQGDSFTKVQLPDGRRGDGRREP